MSGPAGGGPPPRRAWLGGLRARMLLLALASLSLLHLGSIWIYDAQLRGAASTARESQLAERLAAAKRAVAPLAPAERDATAHALATPGMDLHWSPLPALGAAGPPGEPGIAELRRRLVAAAPEIGDIRLAAKDEGEAGPVGHMVVGSLELPDGSWLNFSAARFRPLALASQARAPLASASVMAAGIIAVTLLIAASLTRPLRRVAAAADEIGRTDRPVAVAEEGPDEVRQVARAFNAMQARLLRMSADRALALAAVSHDLRTPLQRLRLRLGFMGDEEAQSRTEADLAEMEAMIDATLTYLRGAGDGRPPEASRVIDLASMLQSLCDDAADTGRDASFEGPDRLPFRCRPIGLKRAVVNLVENALAYGGRARVRLAEQDGGVVAIEVEDDGPGMPEADLPRAFEPFWRQEGSRGRATGGSGLGLTIARRAVEENGGTLELRNRPGGGLLARVRLPRAAPEGASPPGIPRRRGTP